MKELIFIRHGKSDWDNDGLKDIDRFLSDRGYSDAYAMSKWFLENKPLPSFILSSTATRALSTALIFARRFDTDMDRFVLEPSIYESSAETLLALIQKQNNSMTSLMLFGHNPGFTELCNRLAPELRLDNLPTCGIVSLSFDASSWKEINFKKGKLNYYQFPKDFKN